MKHKVIRTFGITAVNFSHFDDVIQVILHFISGENVPDDDNFFVRNTKICAYILFRMYPVWDTSQLGCIPFRGFLNRALCSGFLQRVIFLLVYVFLVLCICEMIPIKKVTITIKAVSKNTVNLKSELS